ncbi:MAG: TonB-dependent receptor [Gammaproteobacteria bacterium]|nr:TonB-dependent receptor [Gammaproteobacteria bacterium]
MKPYSVAGVVAALTLLTGSAIAQQSEGLQEVIVTATKREQTLQDVPVAVSVTPIETIQRASIQNLTDLASVVSSLRVYTLQTSTQTNFVIRGFGNGANNPGIEGSVGVFIDGVYRSRSAGAIGDLVDVSRVEVLRGPQSTLFGQNASAGVISIVTQKPQFTAGGYVEGTLGNYGERILKGKWTGPVSDTVAVSFTGTTNKRDGYFSDLKAGNKINDRDRLDLRGQLLWNASDDLSVRVITDYSDISEVCCGVSNLVNGPTSRIIQSAPVTAIPTLPIPLYVPINGQIYGNDPYGRSAYLNKAPVNSVVNRGTSLHLDWNLGNFKLTSITSVRNQKTDFDYDFDFTSGDLGNTNRNVGDIDTKTQELRLAFDNGGKVRGLLGAYLMKETVRYDNTILLGPGFRSYAAGLFSGAGGATLPASVANLPIPEAYKVALLMNGGEASLRQIEAGIGAPFGTFFRAGTGNNIYTRQNTDASTIFGQLDFNLTDRLTLTGGIAYTNTDKDVDFQQNSNEAFSALNLVQVGYGLILQQLVAAKIPAATAASIADRASVADGATIPCYTAPAPFGALLGPLCNPVLAGYALQFLSPVVPFTDKSKDSKTTYTARFALEINDHVNAYAGVATGYKATSWNLSRDSKPFNPGTPSLSPLGGATNPWYPRYGTRYAGPEESTVYEIGLKSRFNRFALNVAIFDQQIKGFQSNAFSGTGFVLANAGKQSSKGIEIESQFKLTRNLQWDFSGTFLDPKYDSYKNAQTVDKNGNLIVGDLSGSRPANISRTSLVTGLTYSFSVDGTDGFVRADYDYQSKVAISENILESIASRQVNTLNASVGFKKEGWDFLLWGRNLTDDKYLLSAFPSVAQSGSFSAYPSQPRTFGVTVRKAF